MADTISGDVFGKKYSRLFKVKAGIIVKLFRTTLGFLIIQTKFWYFNQGCGGDHRNLLLQCYTRLMKYWEEHEYPGVAWRGLISK